MGRLTVKINGTYEIKGIEDIPCGDVCERNHGCETCKIHKAVEKQAAYEEAEERRINPGDTVYVMDEEMDGVREYIVSKVTYGKYHDVVRFVGGSRFTVWGREWDEYLDKYLFKNKEESEQALARMEDNNSNHEN